MSTVSVYHKLILLFMALTLAKQDLFGQLPFHRHQLSENGRSFRASAAVQPEGPDVFIISRHVF